jgi:hypothetical protein
VVDSNLTGIVRIQTGVPATLLLDDTITALQLVTAPALQGLCPRGSLWKRAVTKVGFVSDGLPTNVLKSSNFLALFRKKPSSSFPH